MKTCSKPCRECPFTGNMAGWLGAYEDWDHLHQTLMLNERFPCHLTMSDSEDNLTPEKEVICKGSLVYMKKCGKFPLNPELKKLMDELTSEELAEGKGYLELKKIHDGK